MGKETGIQWATHTWNPWRGCSKVSEGCQSCYAEAMSVRNPAVLGEWGEGTRRALAAASYMRQPYTWDRAAREAGESGRVFCGSLMDVFEDRGDLLGLRERVLMTAYECSHLNWLFLTKRPENILRHLALAKHLHPPYTDWLTLQRDATRPNWWFGCTVENQRRAQERLPLLLEVPARVRWLSVEPLLGPLDLTPWLATGGIHWVIVGGESTQRADTPARHFDLEWAEELVNQCKSYKVAVFVKQMGSRPLAGGLGLRLKDRHGGDMAEWPEWLRVREVPS